MKHLSIKEGFIYNNVKSGQVNIIYMPTTDNLADFLTKVLPAIKLRGNKIKLNMIMSGPPHCPICWGVLESSSASH